MPEIRQSITTPVNFITTTGTDVGSSIGHSTPAQVRTALGIASGFTYDQQAEPSSPTAGQTWRERTAGGLIVGEWEWSGSLWIAPRETSVSIANSGDTSGFNALANSAGLIVQLPFRQCIAIRAITGVTASTLSASNRWDITISSNTQQNGAASVVLGTWSLTSDLFRIQRVDTLSGVTATGDTMFRVVALKVGTPGTLTMGTTIVVKQVRV